MTSLLSASDLSFLGIDSLERGLIFATISLLAVVRNPSDPRPPSQQPYRNAINLSFESSAVALAIDLPYSLTIATQTALDLLQSVLPYDPEASAPVLERVSPPSLPPFFPIPDVPSAVQTLEGYAVWCSSLLSAVNPAVTVRPTLDSRDQVHPVIQIRARLSLSSSLWLCSQNLIRSVLPLITEDPFTAVFAVGSSLLGSGGIEVDAA